MKYLSPLLKTRLLLPITVTISLITCTIAATEDYDFKLPDGTDFSILPPPPTDDSPAGLADLHVLLYVQENRTPEQVEFAKEMARGASVFAMGREIFGPWFTRENLPQTAKLLRHTTKISDGIKEDAKKNWKRIRPYDRSDKIQPAAGKIGDAGCYPSGHTYGMAIPMFVLTAALPEYTEEFDEKIRRVMWGRIVGGVHFPTDTEAGRLLAQDVISRLLKEEPMQKAIEEIRQEINSVRKQHEKSQSDD